jgi:hypothetical protein
MKWLKIAGVVALAFWMVTVSFQLHKLEALAGDACVYAFLAANASGASAANEAPPSCWFRIGLPDHIPVPRQNSN